MRTIKELLEVMLNNQKHFCNGLCLWASMLYYDDKITLTEYRYLIKYIEDNKPSIFSSFECFIWRINPISDYYWTPAHISPRINWIKNHIKINS